MTGSGDKPVAVVTGATSGIGLETARALAREGMRVIALGRDEARITSAAKEFEAEGLTAQWVNADLSSIAQTHAAAARIAEIVDRIDILVNNAGSLLDTRHVTADGLETMFQVNHLAPYILTLDLLPQLKRSSVPHVITVSSIGHSMIDDLHWDDLQMEISFLPITAYAQSKLANILFTRELAARHAADGIVASAVHPGLVASRFPESAGVETRTYYAAAEKSGEALTSAQGADTIVWLAMDRDRALPSGGYFHERKRVEPSPAAQSEEGAKRLWDISARLSSLETAG